MLRRKRSSVTAFEASTRRYYLEQAAKRSTQTSTGYLAMNTVSLTAPSVPSAVVERTAVEAADEGDNCLSDRTDGYRRRDGQQR